MAVSEIIIEVIVIILVVLVVLVVVVRVEVHEMVVCSVTWSIQSL